MIYLCRQDVATSVASSLRRKTRRLPDDVVPKGEKGTRDRKEETAATTKTGTGARRGTRTSTGMSTRVGMGARTGAGTAMRMYIMVKGKDDLGTCEMMMGVGRKMQKGGRRQQSDQ